MVPSVETGNADWQIRQNIVVHDRIARKYEAIHGEIFNDVEQSRLAGTLARARDAIRTPNPKLRALDFGCGSGNLTRHLLALGLEVTAADVSQGFLDLVRSRYPDVEILLMNGRDLANVDTDSFDLVATYSVLHHVPDYLAAVQEMGRVTRPGGVIVIDHEPTERFWMPDPVYSEFRAKPLRFDWRKYLTPMNYVRRILRVFDPRYTIERDEGDIHVWPHDHIEWSLIAQLLGGVGFEVVFDEEYLLYRRLYCRSVYDQYVGRCTDTKAMIFRKRIAPAHDDE